MPRPNAGIQQNEPGTERKLPNKREGKATSMGKELRPNVAPIAEISASQIARRRHAPVSIASKQTIWADAFSTTTCFGPRRLEIRAKGRAKIPGNIIWMDSFTSLHHQHHGHGTTNEEFRDIRS